MSRKLRDRVLRVAGNPAAFGAPEPDGDIFTAGLSLCQDYPGRRAGSGERRVPLMDEQQERRRTLLFVRCGSAVLVAEGSVPQ